MPATTKFRASLGIIATVVTYTISPIAICAADTPVVVNNTISNPVPTTTTVTNPISNPVNVTVTNPSNKSVPSVIMNQPTSPIPALVMNTAAAPVPTLIINPSSLPVKVSVIDAKVPVSDVNKPAHIPFSKRLDLTFSNGATNQTFTVPANKRLVIKYVSADAGVAVGGNVLFDLATYNQNAEVESHMPMISQGTILGQQVYAMSEQTTIFADPGSTVTIAALNSNSGAGGLIVGVYGYLVDAAAASYE